MYELLYYSMTSRLLTHEELTEILEKSRVKNQQLGITGMLLYYNREFLQLLEGEKPVVKRLYDTIASDPRHSAVEIFYEGHIYQRAFSEWSMAFKTIGETDLKVLAPEDEPFTKGSFSKHLTSANMNLGKKLFFKLREQL